MKEGIPLNLKFPKDATEEFKSAARKIANEAIAKIPQNIKSLPVAEQKKVAYEIIENELRAKGFSTYNPTKYSESNQDSTSSLSIEEI